MDILSQKLDPINYPELDGRMIAILGLILNQRWVDPALKNLSITSEGIMIGQTVESDRIIVLGLVDDVESRLRWLVKTARLDPIEIGWFNQEYNKVKTDWRLL